MNLQTIETVDLGFINGLASNCLLTSLLLILSFAATGSTYAQTTSSPYPNRPETVSDPRDKQLPRQNVPYLNNNDASRIPNARKNGDALRNSNPPDFDGAIVWYNYALEINRKDEQALLGLGLAYKALGEHEEAIQSFQRAILLKPKLFEAHLGLGSAYYSKAEFALAETAFRRAIDIKPKNVEARYDLAITLLRLNNLAGAREQQQIIQSLDRKTGSQLSRILDDAANKTNVDLSPTN